MSLSRRKNSDKQCLDQFIKRCWMAINNQDYKSNIRLMKDKGFEYRGNMYCKTLGDGTVLKCYRDMVMEWDNERLKTWVKRLFEEFLIK